MNLRQRQSAFNDRLREMIARAKSRKSGGAAKKDEPEEKEPDILNDTLPFIRVAVPGLFTGTEFYQIEVQPGGAKGFRGRGQQDTHNATLVEVIEGSRSIQEYVRQHRPLDLVKDLSNLLLSRDAIARLASAAKVSVKQAEAIIRALLAVARGGV